MSTSPDRRRDRLNPPSPTRTRNPPSPTHPRTSPTTSRSALSPIRFTPSTLHPPDDPLILHLTPRALALGFSSDLHPRAALPFTTALLAPHNPLAPAQAKYTPYPLLPLDLRHSPLRLTADILERALRDAYYKHLLLDAKAKKLLLPLPPLFPTPLLREICRVLFDTFMVPAVTVVSAPVMATVAAGLRAGLVVDIGWWETVVTPVFELRELPGVRTRRGVERLRERWREVLGGAAAEAAEEVMARFGWCASRGYGEADVGEGRRVVVPEGVCGREVVLGFAECARPLEEVWMREGERDDDDWWSVPRAAYEALRKCPVDVRRECARRVVVVGEGAEFPGVKERLQEELRRLVEGERWRRGDERPARWRSRMRQEEGAEGWGEREGRRPSTIAEGADGEETEEGKREEGEEVRVVRTLGVWTGASLVAGLKLKGKYEIEREKFLSAVQSGGVGLPRELL